MQSCSINVDHDHLIKQSSTDWIKSLSDDDDDDDKEYECDQFLLQDQPRKQHDINNITQEQPEEPQQQQQQQHQHQHVQQKEQEPFEQLEQNFLDKDKPIFKLLNQKGYKSLHKLCYTDQGSVWRAKSPKKLGSKSVVIKIASKLHYGQRSEHEDIIKEIELLQNINKQPRYLETPQLQLQASECNECECINLIDTIENEQNYIVVLEDGGIELFSFIACVHQLINNEKIDVEEWQKTVKLIASKLIKLINWLHSFVSLCHLDISLENILISNVNWISYRDQYKNYKKKLAPNFALKLIDFGAAECFTQYDMNGNIEFDSNSIIGKPSYCCPQIYKLQNKLTVNTFDARMADVWSYGVCLFIMSIGYPPWTQPDDRNKLFQTIVLEKDLDCVLNAWKRSNYIPDSMKDLLQKIFIVDEKNRISTNDIIKHSWLCINK